jgi:DNA modification methylase
MVVAFPILYISSLFGDDLLVAVQGKANRLWFGDNLEVLQSSIADESVDLVYLDPPFNSSRTHNVIFEKHPDDFEAVAAQIRAFNDTWHWSPATDHLYQRYALAEGLPGPVAAALRALHGLLPEGDTMAYLVHMAPRLAELHRVLKPNGSLYLHCDPAMSHYLKLLLDAVFGVGNFRNEIIWKRSSAHNSARRYGAVHDVILFYSRSRHYTWNRVPQPLSPESAGQWYNNTEPGTGRLFKWADLTAPGTREGPSGEPWRGVNPTDKGRHWAIPGFVADIAGGLPAPQALDALDAAGRIFWPRQAGGVPQVKRYIEEAVGVAAQDVITDIRPLHNVTDERIGYPTQKPVALLERFITASSDRGGVVLDPFCGCGTTIDAAQRLGRNWIGIDIAYVAVDIIVKRLRRNYGSAVSYELNGIPRDVAGAHALADRDKFEFQTWAVTQLDATPTEQRSRDKGIDGVASFYLDRKATGRVIISVKGGTNVLPRDVRDLGGTVQAQQAQMGVFLMRGDPTPGIREAAAHAGTYTWPLNGQVYPKVQVLTVAQMVSGIRPVLPPQVQPYGRRARAAKALDAAALLSGRVLAHARPADVEPLLALLDPQRSGLVLTGTSGMRLAESRRRANDIQCPLICDPAAYLTWRATPQDPFRGPGGPLHGRALESFLKETCRAGAHAVLTPTGFIRGADIDTLQAVLGAAPGLSAETVISLPLDITWATSEWADVLIDLAAATPAPKAIMMTGLPREAVPAKEILHNLRLIASQVPQAAFFRFGLGAFDLMAHGALAASTGTSSVTRQVIPPDPRRLPGESPDEEPAAAPLVLVPDLVSYLPGDVLAAQLAGTVVPCWCRYCAGQSLGRFTARAQWRDARLHGLAAWTEWLPGLLSSASPTERQVAWTRLCQRGLEAHDRFGAGGDDVVKLMPDLPLMFWAREASLSPAGAVALLRSRRRAARG